MSENGHLRDLKSDPMNARRHNPRNVGMIETSIQRNGFGRPILISSDNVVAAGNATIDAAASAGLENVRIIDSDGTEVIAIRRTDVSSDSPTFTNLALSDNRAAELAEWDSDVLKALQEDGADLSGMWYDYELAQVTGNTETDDPNAHWTGMPEYEQEDQRAVKQITVSFAHADDVERFARLVEQTVTMQTKSIWWPMQARQVFADKAYLANGDSDAA